MNVNSSTCKHIESKQGVNCFDNMGGVVEATVSRVQAATVSSSNARTITVLSWIPQISYVHKLKVRAINGLKCVVIVNGGEPGPQWLITWSTLPTSY